MNAREQLIRVISSARFGKVTDGDIADAVLAVLPDLLTDPEVVETAVERLEVLNSRGVAIHVLTAAAKALTEGGAS